MINMPYGGRAEFDENKLVAHILASGRDYIIIGGCNCVLAQHQKPHSLDYWLRGKTNNSNVRQTCHDLIDDLVETGLFVKVDRLPCPDSGVKCSAIRLTQNMDKSK